MYVHIYTHMTYVHVLKYDNIQVRTSVVTHMLPDTSMQKITMDSLGASAPPLAPATPTGAGLIMKVVSLSLGTSSGSKGSISFSVPQYSHVQVYTHIHVQCMYMYTHVLGS